MGIRILQADDIPAVSQLCLDAFMAAVAPQLSEQGVETFRQIASADNFQQRSVLDNTMLVYEQDEEIKGVVELREGRHISMLFVSPLAQKQGVGRALMAAIRSYYRTSIITVSASLSSVPAYQQFGFMPVGEPEEKAGLLYQPMEMALEAVQDQPVPCVMC